MKKFLSFHYTWKAITFLVDAVLIVGAFVAAYGIRLYADPVTYLKLFTVPPLVFSWNDYISLVVPITIVWLVIFFFNGLYHVEKTKEISREISLLFGALNTGVVFYIIITFFRGQQLFSRLIIAYVWVLALVFLVIGRLLLRKIKKFLQRYGYGVKKVLVIGTDQVAEQLLEGFRQKNIWNLKIVGVVTGNGYSHETLCGFPIVGDLAHIEQLVEQHSVGEVILTLSSLSHDKVMEIVDFCTRGAIRFTFVPDMFQLLSSYNTTAMVNGLPLVSLRSTPLQSFNKYIKRIFDLILSVVMLIVLSPIFLLVMLLVKLTSKGPIFHTQDRIGMDGIVFKAIKFRTMYQDAEGKNGLYWTVKNDPRITVFGKWLRKFNLDELPQLFNVLTGEMSLVGPRPEQPRFVEEFSATIPRYMDRYHVKAGMTGWAQVNGWRGDTSIQERVRYDIYYLENWSLWFDLKILFKTFFSFGH